MNNPIQRVRLNNLQYNANRDPQVYRRLPNQPFRIEADLKGNGTATVKFEADDQVKEQKVSLPGKFDCQMSFATAKSRIGKLTVDINGQHFQQDLRLDVMEHAWIG